MFLRLSFKPELVCCSFADHRNVRDHIIIYGVARPSDDIDDNSDDG